MTKEEAWNELFQKLNNKETFAIEPSTAASLVTTLLCDMPNWKVWLEGPDGKPMPIRCYKLLGKDGIVLKYSKPDWEIAGREK